MNMYHRLSKSWAGWSCALVSMLAMIALGQTKPDYPHGDFQGDCATCHGPEGWSPAQIAPSFDHGELSEFTLEGSHRNAPCRSCHISLEFDKAGSDCVSCHRDIHNGELGADCSICHSTINFIDHAEELRSHRLTRFPLSGSHAALDCSSCHEPQPQGGMRFVNTRVDCVACHRAEFQATTSPNHVALGFDEDCTRCHAPLAWETARFDHDASGFPLSGAHSALTCDSCHAGGQFAGAPNQCVACHQADFQQAPNHVSGNYSTDCQTCHTTSGWQGADFQHDFFPLSGGHAAVECTQCHTTGTVGTIPADCVDCHQTDYATAPSHVTGNFPITCETCHTTTTFAGGTFDHNIFPTTGGHAPAQCTDCHTSGSFGTIPSDCFACHQPDYQAAPDHVAVNIPTDCEECHAVTLWTSNTFVHGFPRTGPHDRTCNECHVTGTTQEFSCYGTCHEHTVQKMADKHSGETGYVYDFQACLNCHPNGDD